MASNWKKSFNAIFVAELLAIAGFTASMPIIPFFLQDLGITSPDRINLWNGIVNSAGSLALALMAPIWGRLADSHGRRLMLLRAMFGGAAIFFLTYFTTSPEQFLVLRILQGMITGTIAAATVLVAAIVPEEEVGFRLGLLTTSVFVGSSVGPLIGGLVADFLGNRVTFIATAVILFAAGMIVVRFVDEGQIPRPEGRFSFKSLVPNFRPILESRGLFVLLVLTGMVQVANSSINPILPLYIQAIAPRAAMLGTTTGLIIGISALAAALSAALVGRVSNHLGLGRTLLACTAGAAVFTLPQGFVRFIPALLILRVFSSFGLGAVGPVSNAFIARIADRGRQGTVYGLATSISAGGFALGPIIGAVTATTAGLASAFLTTGLLLAGTAGLAAAFLLPRDEREAA